MRIKLFREISILLLLLQLIIFFSCNNKEESIEKFYPHHLIDFLNDKLNEAIIQDGFSPPVASRIYAYVNLAAYEAYHYDNPNKIKMSGVLNEFEPAYDFPRSKQVDPEFASFTAFYKIAYELVYRDFIVDSLILSHKKYFKSMLPKDIYENSEMLGKVVANKIVAYAKTDNYDKTRSYPLYQLSKKPGSWEPTPPYYGTPIEPFWGEIRPFLITQLDSFKAAEHIPFDTAKGSPFYKLNEHVYQSSMKTNKEQKEIAMYWDGDPMPAWRVRRITLFKRQLNPVGHWLAICKPLNNMSPMTEGEAIESYMRVSLAIADAMIVGWKNKYDFGMIRPHTYVNRYIDKKWDPVLVTPLFPEYPSGHSVLAGSGGGILIDIFGDSVSFVDSSQIRFGHEPRYYQSISEAIDECADSRVLGGIHYIPAVEVGVSLGRKVANLHIDKLHKPKV